MHALGDALYDWSRFNTRGLLQSLRDALAVDGHVVTSATEGAQGMKLLREAHSRAEPFDLVITDLGMPTWIAGRSRPRSASFRLKHPCGS